MYNLVSFPDYSVDVNTGKVYSHKLGKTKEISARYTRASGQVVVSITIGGKSHNISLARLIASAKYKCDYYSLPKDILCLWSLETGLQITDKSQQAVISNRKHKKSLEYDNSEKLQILDNVVMEIGLIRQAYLGDINPLTNYLQQHRSEYINMCANSSYIINGGGKNLLQDIIDDAIYTFLDTVARGKRNILLIKPWIYKTAIGMIKNRRSRKHVELNENRIFHKKAI